MTYKRRDSGKPHEYEIIEVIGKVRYEAGRNYPWYGQNGCVGSFFATQSEAVEFARTGEIRE